MGFTHILKVFELWQGWHTMMGSGSCPSIDSGKALFLG